MNEKYTPEIVDGGYEQQKEKIDRQLKHLQVLFCDRLFCEYKKECQKENRAVNKNFSDYIEENGGWYAGELRMLAIMSSAKELTEKEQDELLAKKYYPEIDRLYDALLQGSTDDNFFEHIQNRLGELEVLIDYLEEEAKKISNEFPDKWQTMHQSEEEKRAGLIIFNSSEDYDTPEIRHTKKVLKEKTDFSEFDKFIEMHWPAQFGEQKIDPETIIDSLKYLAKKIADEFPDTRAVVMTSWLLDHPKFKEIFDMKIIGEGENNWQQLIGSNRQIRKDRVEVLLTTGKMPYRNLIGYTSTEAFCKKYLPNNRSK